jgi:membrane protein YqaA with SNARE-associated domain
MTILAWPMHDPRRYNRSMFDSWIASLLAWLSLPQYGLGSVFVVSFVSATLIPLGSEPAVYGMVKLRPDLFWETIAIATVGNTLGGVVDYWMGRGAEWMLERRLNLDEHGLPVAATANDGRAAPTRWHQRAVGWLERFGPMGCLLAWLPGIGDPLCSVAGWLRLPFWRCVMWMAIGKCLRYITMTAGLIWMF